MRRGLWTELRGAVHLKVRKRSLRKRLAGNDREKEGARAVWNLRNEGKE
jgi:hypothetical protein